MPVSVSTGTLAPEHTTAVAAHQTATRVVRTSGPGQRVETTVLVPAALSLALLRALRWALDRARYRAGESEWARGDTARRWRGR
ncbi:hypothetical protein [Nocardioides sp. L-11A]|uniref:hypothetical protein n=1 Tax=Nocardioides sp. L-11A TaxID=3043848 RepID=UPI00249A58D9|nr:hypothetical protein QJ852_18200 [Nocardioides sp. L-11A]